MAYAGMMCEFHPDNSRYPDSRIHFLLIIRIVEYIPPYFSIRILKYGFKYPLYIIIRVFQNPDNERHPDISIHFYILEVRFLLPISVSTFNYEDSKMNRLLSG